MPEAFSLNREYDFVRLEGLQRATGRPAHEWDLYILKELLDNALDADEALWYNDINQYPDISVDIEYISVPPPQYQQLLVRVGNRASFPVEKVEDIFATQWYTSRKAFLKGLTRGTLGNALKTLLGIPYALHNRLAEDWRPDLKPFSICLDSTEYIPRYTIDSITQEIRLTLETKGCRYQRGTVITIGLDYFVQEIDRTQQELVALAAHYHICNPHAAFRWNIEVEDQVWEREYSPQHSWRQKFSGAAPIQWYSLADFKELLGALYREQNQNNSGSASSLFIEPVCHYFSGFRPSEEISYTNAVPLAVLQEVQQASLTAADIEGAVAKTFYTSLSKHTLPFPPVRLGAIGREFLETALKEHFPLEGTIQYLEGIDPEGDPRMPFVLEVAAAYLKTGKRQLWTVLNFSPTYNDPFLSRYLFAPVQPNTPVLGLRGLLDAYNLREDTPMLLFMHLICPTIEHNEFSKTEINHLPFKKVLGEVLHQVLTALRRSREEDDLQFEQIVYQVLDMMAQLPEHQHFIADQLLELLYQYPALAPWLDRPDIMSRLRISINNYQIRNASGSDFMARQADVLLHLPSHPVRYFSIPLEQLSSDLLAQHCVNKLLYIQMAELVPIMLANNWLCRMDMALLAVPPLCRAEEVLLYCARQCDLPLLILHKGDAAGVRLSEWVRSALKPLDNEQRVIDLSLLVTEETMQFSRLMPDEQESWLLQRFDKLDVAIKSIPPSAQIRQDLSTQFEQRLRGYFVERMGQRFEIANLLIELDRIFAYVKMMVDQKLDQRLITDLHERLRTETYSTVVSKVAEDFFEQFMDEYGGKVRQREQLWLEERQEKRHER